MKKAFTLIEIIFVIVVVGILSSIAIQKFNSKDLLRGAEMIARDIEYTKHLAIVDDNKMPNDVDLSSKLIFPSGKPNQHHFWVISFVKITEGSSKDNVKLSIFKFTDTSDATLETAAVDYIDNDKFLAVGKGGVDILNRTSPRVDLKKTYAITKIDNSECKVENGANVERANTILFDEEGVPYVAKSTYTGGFSWVNYIQKLKSICTLKISAGSSVKCIDIYPETGYVKVKECS